MSATQRMRCRKNIANDCTVELDLYSTLNNRKGQDIRKTEDLYLKATGLRILSHKPQFKLVKNGSFET